jgi:hypothetical protein
MTLDEAIHLITATAERMDQLYKDKVFDEFAVVAFLQNKARLLKYIGPRREDFQKNFLADVREIKPDLIANKHNIGDFEFSQSGVGTKVEAFLVLSDGIFLLCNHTSRNMTDIARNPMWLSAQVPFVEMSDRFRSNPLIHPV